jgi:putative phosphoserine phosphatase/1-acylglycerol-3-phosphate O-acyltransferase
LVRLIAGVLLFLVLATSALLLAAVTWSPGFVMRAIAPRWGRWMCWVVGIRLEVEGREHLDRPAVIVANHQSAMEAFIFPAVLPPKVRYVGKKEVGNIPFFGWVFRATGQVLVDRGDTQAAIAAIDASLATLPKGVSVFLCPEGTRSPDGTLGPFKKGAFHIAMKLGVPVVPLTLDGAQHLLPKHTRLPRPGTVKIRISPPVDTAKWRPETVDEHVAEVRGIIARELDQFRGLSSPK